jgi:hypothetical protein
MSEQETFDENGVNGLYNHIFAGGLNASEKVWFRMWYEPQHWDKDLNANGQFDRNLTNPDLPLAPSNPTPTNIDEWYPAIMQEFTYLLTEAGRASDRPQPTFGQVGMTSFVFPVGIRRADLNSPVGYGLTSFDANWDNVPDIVAVDSELTLFDKFGIAADFDGDATIDPLDGDGLPLSGDELAVFHTEAISLPRGSYIQFLDHVVRLVEVFDDSVSLAITYVGSKSPGSTITRTLYVGDLALAGTNGVQVITAVRNGGPGTNGGSLACAQFPPGPFFVTLRSVDTASQQESAILVAGRAIGATWSGMEDVAGSPDDRPGDPWFLKRFYVDGHEYNAVAIRTSGSGGTFTDANCDLRDGPPLSQSDRTSFQSITVRTPVPKVDVTIEQHSVQLEAYQVFNTNPPTSEPLSVMPPFNFEHYILLDVQAISRFNAPPGSGVYFMGGLTGPVAPILQTNGPSPYPGIYPQTPVGPYTNQRETQLVYTLESSNPVYLGQLLEKYGEAPLIEGPPEEFFYAEQWWTLPWQFTEFLLPDIGGDLVADLYLLTSAFLAPQGEYLQWIQGNPPFSPLRYHTRWDGSRWVTDTANDFDPNLWRPRVQFWFDPTSADKQFMDGAGLRLHGRDNQGAGDPNVTDPQQTSYPVEVPPYTDPWAPFNPQFSQSPRKDSLTFSPAFMAEFPRESDPLSDLYSRISVDGDNAREKAYLRMWYEPGYLDKIRRGSATRINGRVIITATEVYTFSALQQEYTFLLLHPNDDRPIHGQPGRSQIVFPTATRADELPKPVNGQIPAGLSRGYGLTTFDPNFDGAHDIVQVHSEHSLANVTGIQASFDGDSSVDYLDTDGQPLSGDELVVLAVSDITLYRGQSVQFLDHMITLDNVAYGNTAELQFWYTGGGLHGPGPDYSIYPDKIGGPMPLRQHDMAIANKTSVRWVPAGTSRLGFTDGAWFVWIISQPTDNPDRVSVMVGRALGATHSAIDNGAAGHDLAAGDPWYLKRFFVDGHEYNVVAVHVVPADTPLNPGDEPYEFKYLTLRTPVPKPVSFVNTQDSLVLQGYFDVFTPTISVLPPFNFTHTIATDIVGLNATDFANSLVYDPNCVGTLRFGVAPLRIQIVNEATAATRLGELKQLLWPAAPDVWSTHQFHVFPDRFTELALPAGQNYLVTSDWRSDQSRLHYYACRTAGADQAALNALNDEIPAPTTGLNYFQADPARTVRVKFWHNPDLTRDSDGLLCHGDIYINCRRRPPPTGVELTAFSGRPSAPATAWPVAWGLVGLVGLTAGAIARRRRPKSR